MMTCEQFLYFYPFVDKVRLAKYGTFIAHKQAVALLGEAVAALGADLVRGADLPRRERRGAVFKRRIGKDWYYVVPAGKQVGVGGP